MAKRARRKQNGVLATLFVELSALMGILGIAQPSVRNNLWSIVNPSAVTSAQNAQGTVGSLASGSQAGNFGMQFIPQTPPIQQAPQPIYQQSYVGSNPGQLPSGTALYSSAPSQVYYSPTYTAQATLPLSVTNRPRWQASTYSPMGGYQ